MLAPRRVRLLVLLLCVLPLLHDMVPHAGLHEALAQAGFSFTFDGDPAVPERWHPTAWDVQRNVSDGYRQVGTEGAGSWMPPMRAHHGPACEAPPATHPVNHVEDAVFLCNDHVMTAMNAGYGAIYLTPNAQADFSSGEAVIRWDLSTATTVGRDWVDVWITPYEDNLALPLQDWLPPYQGEPRRAVHLRMDGTGDDVGGPYFLGTVIRNHVATNLPAGGGQGMYRTLAPSASRRDTFEVRISRTRVKIGMPAYNNWWLDTPIDPPLDWSAGVVTFGHHAYSPTKGCDESNGGADPNGVCANTWHWDNVSIAPARPFTILPALPRLVDRLTTNRLDFPAPSPANAALRFSGHGQVLELSADNGATWLPARRQPQERNADEHWSTYMTPIPPGLASVLVRGQASWSGPWAIQDAAVWASDAVQPPPGPTPTPTVAPTATPTPIPGTLLTITFDDAAGQNQPLNGQYPAGLIDWGTNRWYLSAPWRRFTTKSIGFNGAGPVSAAFTFVSPRTVVRIDAYNGGTVPSTITLACSGLPTVSATLAPDQLATIPTGWATPCTAVTLGSTNGWDTNFDNLVVMQ